MKTLVIVIAVVLLAAITWFNLFEYVSGSERLLIRVNRFTSSVQVYNFYADDGMWTEPVDGGVKEL